MIKNMVVFKLVFALMLVVLSPGTAFGAEEAPPEENRSEDSDYAEDIVNFEKYDVITDDLEVISTAGSDIYDRGSNRVEMRGILETVFAVDEISVELTLQRWDSGRWEDVTDVEFSETNSYSLNKTEIEEVASGYYRVEGIHTAKQGSDEQVIETQTDYIEIE